jgi:hypothetical protein
MTHEFSWQIFEKESANIKFYQNSSIGSWTDGQKDMTKLIFAFRNFANVPNNMEQTSLEKLIIIQHLVKSSYFLETEC